MDDIEYCKLLEKLNRELNGYRERIVSVIGATGPTGATGGEFGQCRGCMCFNCFA